ncbi:LysR family transcriptional regulator [Pseudolabrys sp. FHR47]|uniref:LysR family transcriptional regulator n=1 Tax=Pseudolabrys sp. FHR47 TaxID=2562284 RepID=UPI00143DE789|nr:LysR family transcriptional regulator [Pseudolabrys sp. FHR47]
MNLRQVDLNLLTTFEELMTQRSVSHVAERLGVTQPAISHSLNKLRLLFGDQLLVRGPGGMQPTARAIALYPQVREALASIHSLLSTTILFDPAHSERTFRISMTDAVIVEALPFIIRRIRQSAPNINLTITASVAQDDTQRLNDDKVDLAIGVFPHVEANLISRELYRDTIVCIADKNNKLLKNGRLDLSSYLSSPHITVGPDHDTGLQLDVLMNSLGIGRRIVAAVPHFLSVQSLIGGTDLVAHTRRRLLSIFRTTNDLAIFPVPLPMKVPDLEFVQLWHRRYDGDPGHRWLRDMVLEAIRTALPDPARRAHNATRKHRKKKVR